MKVLYFDHGGYCVWSKRLEQGQFQVHWDSARKATLDLTALKLIIEGIDTGSVRRLKRYQHPRNARHLIPHSV